jgi:LysR family transcriptional regulator, nitrogen assimilation regulatory protein
MDSFIQPKWHAFMAVAELGSLSRAALELGCPSSQLSRQMNALESQCGHRLFVRTGRGLVLSEQGQLIHRHLKQLIRNTQLAQEEIDQAMSEPMGEVCVGLLPTLVHSMAADLFMRIRQNHPKIRLHLTDAPSPYLQEWLQLGRLHLATLIRENEEKSSDDPLLAELKLHLIGSRSSSLAGHSSIAVKDMLRLPLILPAAPHPLRNRLSVLAKQHDLPLNVTTEANSVTLQIELASANAGYAIVAESTTPSHVNSKRIFSIPIAQPGLKRQLVLVSSPVLPSSKAVQVVQQTLLDLKGKIQMV